MRAMALKSESDGYYDSARKYARPNKLRKGDLYVGDVEDAYIAHMALRSRPQARMRGCYFQKAGPRIRARIAPARRALQFCRDTKLRFRCHVFRFPKLFGFFGRFLVFKNGSFLLLRRAVRGNACFTVLINFKVDGVILIFLI